MPSRKARGGGRQPGPSRTGIGIKSKQRETRRSAAVPRAAAVAEDEVAPEEQPTVHKKRKLEQPPSLEAHVRFFALSQLRCTGAYDDTRPWPKRRRVESKKKHGQDQMEQPVQMPPHGCGPPPTSAMSRLPQALQIRTKQQQQQNDPVTSMGILGKLPTETRDAIFRHVLVWPGDVRVLQGWSLAFPRTRPRLPGVALLRTCEVLRRQGARLLYGENRFVHLVRDPPAADAETTRRVLRGVYGYGSCGAGNGGPILGGLNIPIDRYGHLIRHVAIVVEANRMADREHRDNFLRSIAKLGPGGGLPFPANLHTVTIQVPALSGKDLQRGYGYCQHHHGGDGGGDNGGGGECDQDIVVPICSFFDSKAISALKRLNTKFIRILATDRCDRLLESVIDLRYYSTKQHHAQISNGSNNNSGEEDPAARDQVLMVAREERACRAIARLQTLSYNLQLLALYPQNAMRKRDMWTVVERDKPVIEYIELGQDFRDSVELESPPPPSRPRGRKREKERGQQQQLTEKWLEEIETGTTGAGNGNGESSSSSQPQQQQQFLHGDTGSPPLHELEARLSLLKAATDDSGGNIQAPPKATTIDAAATSARKGKNKISIKIKPKKDTAETTMVPKKRHQQQQAGKNSKAPRPPPETEAQIIAREREIDRINRMAAPAVALMRAERIAKEKEQAAKEAAAAAAAAARAAGKHGEGGGGGEKNAYATAPACGANSTVVPSIATPATTTTPATSSSNGADTN
ncbi:hypothetical protein SLS62_000747 [Diatrype stigma]|uniref:Uncharacterized protein n=1 Tax=Diatrype stigma TaxID=117547 RepID=A0AAN9UZH1_9PEZI